MNHLPASVLPSGRIASYAVALAGLLTSCAGPKIERTEERVTIKTPPSARIVVTVKNGETTVESTPIPIWESLISGVTGGLVNALKPRSEDP